MFSPCVRPFLFSSSVCSQSWRNDINWLWIECLATHSSAPEAISILIMRKKTKGQKNILWYRDQGSQMTPTQGGDFRRPSGGGRDGGYGNRSQSYSRGSDRGSERGYSSSPAPSRLAWIHLHLLWLLYLLRLAKLYRQSWLSLLGLVVWLRNVMNGFEDSDSGHFLVTFISQLWLY